METKPLVSGLPDRNSPEWLVRQVGRVHRHAVDAMLSRYSLHKPGQPIILVILQSAQEEGRAVSQGDLAEAMRVSPPTVTASLKSLERQGYVRREADARDMRRKLLVLTELGSEAAAQCRAAFHKVDAAMLEGFSPEERRQTAALLRRIVDNLSAAEKR